MSGGIAYVYDPDDVFATRLNHGMVRLQSLSDQDRDFVQRTVADHVRHTGSAVGQRVLDAWESEAGNFKRVMPVDYERVLGVMQAAEAEGLDEDATLARVMEASRG